MRNVVDIVLTGSAGRQTLTAFFNYLFSSVLDVMNTDMHIMGFNLNLWHFLVADVVLCGIGFLIGRAFFGGRG